jgi:tetratricopeptide (TPR) repeat protein
MERGNFADAITQFTQAIEHADRPAIALSKRGVCHIRLGERELAARDFEEALRVDARCLSALVNLGNMALEEDRVDDAIARYSAALKLDEDYAMAHHNLGVAYRRQGKVAQSVRELRTAAKLEQRSKSILRRLLPGRRS